MTLVIGHRGAPQAAPENTLAGFAAALDEGADGFELDVRAGPRGELALRHDAEVATGNPDPARLEDALALAVEHGALVDVEVKETGVAAAAAAAVLASGAAAIVSSFDPDAVRAAGAAAPTVRAGLVVRRDHPDPEGAARACGAAVLCAQTPLDTGLELWLWTIDAPDALHEAFADPRVAAVVTNAPGRAVGLRDGGSLGR